MSVKLKITWMHHEFLELEFLFALGSDCDNTCKSRATVLFANQSGKFCRS